MDPKTGQFYTEDEMQALTPEHRESLIPLTEEQFNELKDAREKELAELTLDEILAKEAAELKSVVDDFANVIEMKGETPYKPNRQQRRAMDRKQRKQKFVNNSKKGER